MMPRLVRIRKAVVVATLMVLAPALQGGAGAAPLSQGDPPSLIDTISLVDRALMFVDAGNATGSGFLFGQSSIVLTNKHVVSDVGLDGEVSVRPLEQFADGRVSLGRPLTGVVRVMHPKHDLAAIEILSPLPQDCRPLTPVPGRGLLPRGSEILVHGFPATQVPIVSRGIVSAHHHNFSDDEPLYVLDAASGSGSSGGPMTDAQGRLAGVVSAVYDVPEDLGSTWGFAIPVSQVLGLFDAEGRLKAASPPASLEQLLAKVRGAEAGVARIEAVRAGVSTILESRADLRTLSRDVADFFERSSMYVTLRNQREGRLFMAMMLDQTAASIRRGAELGMGGDDAADDPSFLEEVQAQEERGRQVGERIMQRAISELDEERVALVVSGMLDATSERAEQAVKAVPVSVDRLGPLVAGDLLAMREKGREEVIEAMANVGLLKALIEIGGEMLSIEISRAERDAMPRSFRASLDRFEIAMSRLERQWMSIPDSVRTLLEDDESGFADAEAVRRALRAEGFQLVAGESRLIRVGEGGDVSEFIIGSGSGIMAMTVMAESLDGVDVDLVLRMPGGEVAGIDEAVDAFPFVLVEAPVSGRWSVQVINADGQLTSVRLERWIKR
jgi:S1-C subfamily serine protease